MPKRKAIPSPTQPSLSHFLPAGKQSLHLPKRTKLKQEEEVSSASVDSQCLSTSCPSAPVGDATDIIEILELVDEVILFAGKPVLWSHIHEEIQSLHRRSIELEHLSGILSVMPEYYTIETGYKKLPQGGYKPEYKLSILKSQKHNRITRFKHVLESMKSVSEYTLPPLPSKLPLLTYTSTEQKSILIKSLSTKSTKPVPTAPQQPISVFLTSQKPKSSLESRKSSLLDRIRAKSSVKSGLANKSAAAAWQRGEWVLTRYPGKPRVAVALKTMVAELVASSSIPVSEGMVRDVIDVVSGCVPWFCKVIKISEQGCMSSQSIMKTKENNGKVVFRGKENGLGKEVEGLLIFAKREGGKLIGREEVLGEFLVKRKEWEERNIC